MTLAFVFPGQGSQKVGMGRALFEQSTTVFDEADAALGYPLSKIMFDGPDEVLQLTAHAQPAILTLSIAVLRALGIQPDFVAGHSLGEYSALVCAHVLSFADAVRLVHKRGQYMQDAVPVGTGGMAAVMGLDDAGVAKLCESAGVELANDNGAGQFVVAGTVAAVERAATAAKSLGGKVIPLKVSAPFHCSLMAPAAAKLKTDIASLHFAPALMPVICNVDASPRREGFASMLERQVTSTVQWARTTRKLADLGVSRAVEVGPGKTLSGLIKRTEERMKCSPCETPADIEACRALPR